METTMTPAKPQPETPTTINKTERYIPEIVACLKQIDPAKVILFGSHARDAATEESDLDLIVVTKSTALPRNYQEKERIYLEVARVLRDIRKLVPVDLLVHTQPMYARFIEMDSLFAREVLREGIVVYESHNP